MTSAGERGLVLVVEDDRAIVELVALYLRRDGFGVLAESDGESALAGPWWAGSPAGRRSRPEMLGPPADRRGESLADEVVTGAEVASAGATIVREADRLERLVTDLMELARLEADDFAVDLTDVDLTALVTEAGQVWDLRARAAGVELRVEAPGRPAPVLADPRRLRQVLDGLAENALRVTPAGSVLVLAALDEGALQVRDSGPGLFDEDYAVVFERGALHDRYRGRRPTGAGGVGLALAHGLVTRMGGRIAAGPAVEGGVAFTVTLRGPA